MSTLLSREALSDFVKHYCLGDSALIACAEAMYAKCEAAVLEAQGKQEPVAWLIEDSNGDGKAIRAKDIDRATLLRFIAVTRTPLYAAPVAPPAELAAEYTRGRNDGWEAAEAKYNAGVQPGMVKQIQPGEKLFEFRSKQDWINKAQRIWKQHEVRSQNTICVDQKGRVCGWGEHFSIAERDNAYPIEVFRLRQDMIAAAEGKE